MNNKLLTFMAFLAIFASCQQEISEPLCEETVLHTSVESLAGIQREIAVNILTRKFGGYSCVNGNTRASENFSLTPYIIDGDTVMYIAQYRDGWEIYSGSHATEMILFSSPEGVFSMSDPSLPDQLRFLIQGEASEIKNIMKEGSDYIDPSWGYMAVSDEMIENASVVAHSDNGEVLSVTSGNIPPGHWVLIESREEEEDSYVSPRLTKTKWGQKSPWNAYCPWKVDPNDNILKQCVAGCTAVAVSQYLYFTHFKDGIPRMSAAAARLNTEGTDYIFYLAATNTWFSMSLHRGDVNTNNVALLIGDVGHAIDTDYGLSSSSAKAPNMIAYLNSTFKNKTCTEEQFTYSLVKSWIDKGYPLISSARRYINPILTSGHMFIIDGYREYTTVNKYIYGLVRDPLPEGAVDPWLSDIKDQYGNIIQYAYTKEVIIDGQDFNFIYMNWGWDGAYNDVECTPDDGWQAGGYNYTISKTVYPIE